MTYQYDEISDMIGVTMIRVLGAESGNDEMVFESENGTKYIFYHSQDCCESVYLDEIHGDIHWLVGSPITQAEEISNEPPPESESRFKDDSETWTFYKFATVKGSVTVRWYGTSNGYYSERVDFRIERT